MKGNFLDIYKNLIGNGIVNVKADLSYHIDIVVADFRGNTSTIKIPVKGIKSNTLFKELSDTTAYKINADKFHKWNKKGVSIAFPKNTFYNDIFLDFKVDSNKVKVHTPVIPLNKSFTLTFDVSN